jgi:hypothetical protein
LEMARPRAVGASDGLGAGRLQRRRAPNVANHAATSNSACLM